MKPRQLEFFQERLACEQCKLHETESMYFEIYPTLRSKEIYYQNLIIWCKEGRINTFS